MKQSQTLAAICLLAGLGYSILGIQGNQAQSKTSIPSKESLYMPAAQLIQGKTFVPVNITQSKVSWKISKDLRQIEAEARLEFLVQDTGRPILLLNPNAQVRMNQKNIAIQKLEAPDFAQSQYYGLDQIIEAGVPTTIQVTYSFNYDPSTTKHILPLEYYAHKFVEMGIPANGSYDEFPLELNLSIEDGEKYEVFANGQVRQLGNGKFKVTYPSYFTSLSFFIDVAPKESVVREERTVQSVDGRQLQVLVYGEDAATNKWISTFAGIIEYTFYEMEKMFGAYPQETIIMKLSDKSVGGGAYAGAMVLSSDYMEHISHELGHSWFLQSVRPARGEDAWIYEGFGNWAPMFGYRSGFAKDLNLKDSVVLETGDYKLWATPEMFPLKGIRNPHQTGSMILASIDQFIKTSGSEDLKGGLVPVLAMIAAEKKHQTMSTQDFKNLLEKHTGLDFTELFDFYIKD